jgi:hypothetical protein
MGFSFARPRAQREPQSVYANPITLIWDFRVDVIGIAVAVVA